MILSGEREENFMKNRVVNYKGYVISTEEGIEIGLFLRNPLQKVDFDAYYDDSKMSAWKYLNDLKNPFRRIFEFLIGNGNIVKNINDWSNDVDWGGFIGNILCCPVYFKREFRKLNAISSGDDNIQEIHSYGYESEFNFCSGHCDIEKTVIKLKNGKKIKIKRNKQYHFTYEHLVKEIIDTGVVEK